MKLGTKFFGLTAIVLFFGLPAKAAEPAGGNVAKPVMLKGVYGEMPLPSGCREGIFPLRTAKRIELKLPSGQAAYLILPTKAPPQGARPWVIYAPHTMGDTWIWERLLDAGFAIAAAPGVAEWLGKPEALSGSTLHLSGSLGTTHLIETQ